MGTEDDLHAVISGIYDAALEPALWESLLLRLSDVMCGALITFHIQDTTGRIRFWRGIRADPDLSDRFIASGEYTEPDLKPMAALLAAPAAAFVRRETIQTDADFSRSAIYNDIIRPQGLWHWGFSTVAKERDAAAIFGILRRESAGEYDHHELALMDRLMPHFQRAAQIALRLGTLDKGQHVLADALLEALSIGVAIVAADARLLHANRIAETVLRTGKGIAVRQGFLRPESNGDARTFERTVQFASRAGSGKDSSSGGMLHLRRSDGTTLPVLIAPLPPAVLVTAVPSAAVIFADPNAASVTPWTLLAARWNLTRAEARLLAALAAGHDLSSYADATGVGIGTVRTHLKQIFAKTGFRRQAELVRAVLSDPLMRLGTWMRDF